MSEERIKRIRESQVNTARDLAVSCAAALRGVMGEDTVLSVVFPDGAHLFLRQTDLCLTIHLSRVEVENEADPEPEGESSPNPSSDEGA